MPERDAGDDALASAGRIALKALAGAVQACDDIALLGSHESIQGDVSPDNLIWAEEQVPLKDFQTAHRLTVSCLLPAAEPAPPARSVPIP